MTKRELLKDEEFKKADMDASIEILSDPLTSWEVLSIYPSKDGRKIILDIEKT